MNPRESYWKVTVFDNKQEKMDDEFEWKDRRKARLCTRFVGLEIFLQFTWKQLWPRMAHRPHFLY